MTLTCYCIGTSDRKRTYIGATNDFKRRLRQHNGEIVGGAKYTKGGSWSPIILVTGFTDRSSLLRFEWWWKHIQRKNRENPLYRRISMLENLLQKPQWGELTVYTDEETAALINIKNEICDICDVYL